MKNILKLTVLASALVVAFSCTKDFEKINTDPDAYTEVPPTYQLSYVLTQTAIQMADITGPNIWAGYLCKLSYIDRYNLHRKHIFQHNEFRFRTSGFGFRLRYTLPFQNLPLFLF